MFPAIIREHNDVAVDSLASYWGVWVQIPSKDRLIMFFSVHPGNAVILP